MDGIVSAPLRYREFRFWSVVLGRDASRLSMFDSHGDEHFAVVPMDGGGTHNRWVRRRALEMLAEHVNAGEPAGEVEIDLSEEREAA